MNYLLDTNACVMLIRQKSPHLLARLLSHEIADICLSAITVAELQYGVHRSNQPERNQQALDQFLIPLTILPFDGEAAAVYGEIRAKLEAKGLPIVASNTLIAAQAISKGLILVTNNVNEFVRVEGLIVEDWTKP